MAPLRKAAAWIPSQPSLETCLAFSNRASKFFGSRTFLAFAVLPASCVARIISMAFALNLFITKGLVPLMLISKNRKSGALMLMASSVVLVLLAVAMVVLSIE